MPARIYDFRDTDVMAKLAEQGADGATASDLAAELGVRDEDGRSGMGPRLAWMKKFGMLSYDDKRHLWRLSDGGERVIEARSRAAATAVIESVPDESMVEVMAHVTARYRLGDPLMANLLRREFQYGTTPGSTAWKRR